MKNSIIIGPPGTGKTTSLMEVIEDYLAMGVHPEEICFVTFTKKAAEEARERAKAKFKLKPDQLKWFRTIHSFAFAYLGMDKSCVMGFSNYIDICNALGLTISSHKISEEGFTAAMVTKGDRLFFLENMSRITGRSLRDTWSSYPDDDIPYEELLQLSQTLAKYKEVRDKVDFTDMISEFNKNGKSPEFKVLIVDEAQDLAKNQWTMIDIIRKNSKDFYVAGDDDQAIYAWAGADVGHFMNLKGHRKILQTSYRIPKKVHELATLVASRIICRTQKKYDPRSEDGSVVYHNTIDTLDMKEGTWLLLARNIYQLLDYCELCIQRNHLFDSKWGSPIPEDSVRVIRGWELLRLGESISAGHCKEIYQYLSTKRKVKFGLKQVLDREPDDKMLRIEDLSKTYGLLTTEPWDKALDKMNPSTRLYFANAIAKGEKIGLNSRIRISTIHGVKGGEADNVAIMTDMSRRTFDHYQANPDNEHRVWYVGVTRAKNSLHIIQPQSSFSYLL